MKSMSIQTLLDFLILENTNMKNEFQKITKQIRDKYPDKKLMIVVEPDTNGIDKYVVAYESFQKSDLTGYYRGATIDQIKMSDYE